MRIFVPLPQRDSVITEVLKVGVNPRVENVYPQPQDEPKVTQCLLDYL